MKIFHLPDNLEQIRQVYDTLGYVIVDDFLPSPAAQSLHQTYEKSEWKLIDQKRPDHYKHVFETANDRLPRGDEPYLARFDRSGPMEQSEDFQALFRSHFILNLKEISRKELTQFDSRCYRLNPGHFYRAHIDDYAGEVGIVYYLNERWCWDWGGLLTIIAGEDPDVCDVIFPKFNRLVVLNHRRFRFPHFISPVTEYAKVPRYTIVSFCK